LYEDITKNNHLHITQRNLTPPNSIVAPVDQTVTTFSIKPFQKRFAVKPFQKRFAIKPFQKRLQVDQPFSAN